MKYFFSAFLRWDPGLTTYMPNTTSLAGTVPHTVVLPSPMMSLTSQQFESFFFGAGLPFRGRRGGSVAERECGIGGKATNGLCGRPEL